MYAKYNADDDYIRVNNFDVTYNTIDPLTYEDESKPFYNIMDGSFFLYPVPTEAVVE